MKKIWERIKNFILLAVILSLFAGCATTAYLPSTCPPCASIEGIYTPVDQEWVKLNVDKHIIYGLEEEKAKVFIDEVRMLLEWARRCDKTMKINQPEITSIP